MVVCEQYIAIIGVPVYWTAGGICRQIFAPPTPRAAFLGFKKNYKNFKI
jgi:hypothetical protein